MKHNIFKPYQQSMIIMNEWSLYPKIILSVKQNLYTISKCIFIGIGVHFSCIFIIKWLIWIDKGVRGRAVECRHTIKFFDF